jgi:hypothetical protein
MKPTALLNYFTEKDFHIYIDGGKVIQDFLRENLVDGVNYFTSADNYRNWYSIVRLS